MHILVLKSTTDANDVLHRLQTNALFRGLQQLRINTSLTFLDGTPKEITAPSHIVFGYRDREAALASAKIKSEYRCKILCFISDVYDMSQFIKLSEFVDIFLAPTPLHRDVVQAAVNKRVVYIPEAYDPIALPAGGIEDKLDMTNRICWFGFPESFSKSMKYLLSPAFDMSSFDKKRFCILTSANNNLCEGVEHRVFHANSFYSDTTDMNYSLLSHFCYDQALNTFIKSPNKMITSIVRGLVPYVSATPSYSHVAKKYGMETLLYRSPKELAGKLQSADFIRDSERIGISQIRAELINSLSPLSIAKLVLNIL